MFFWTDADIDRMRGFFKEWSTEKDVKDWTAVTRFQDMVKQRRLDEKHAKETNPIDAVMGTVTDAIQMVFMLVACSLFVIFGVRNTGTQGIIQGLSGISGDYTTLFSGKGVEIFLAFGLPTTIGLLSGPFGDQSFWQRAFAVKKEKLGRAFLLGAVLFAVVPLSMGILGFMGAGAGYQAQNLGIINFELIRHFFPSWAVLPFLFMIVSGLLSTVDSNLCAVSSLTTDYCLKCFNIFIIKRWCYKFNSIFIHQFTSRFSNWTNT